jgi:formylglycine-generating enzyme required for sulfatase activity
MSTYTRTGEKITILLKNSQLVLIEIPAGEFLMGSSNDSESALSDEKPQHHVTLDSFYMGETAVTQQQWADVAALPMVERFLNPDPSHFKGPNRPVECVSWHDTQEFMARLAAFTGLPLTLPSEAQLEYACRAGTETDFNVGDKLSEKDANFGSHNSHTVDVCTYPPNQFGLYEMHGNVFEWCQDSYHSNYNGAPTDGSAWTD